MSISYLKCISAEGHRKVDSTIRRTYLWKKHYFGYQILRAVICIVMTGVVVLLTLPVAAQDLENLSEIKPVTTSGSVGFKTIYTNTSDTTNQREPWFWQFNANLNLNLLGVIDAPMSVVFNSQTNAVNQPALPTQFGISPKYKSITAHAGYRSMRFSDYSLGGLMFLGGGLEYNPEDQWFSASAMYGRFSEALQPVIGTGLGKYERKGYGLKLNAGDRQNYVSLIGFRASDDPNSVDVTRLEEDLAPQDNLIWSVLAGKQVGKLSLRTELTTSALTRDTRQEDTRANDYSYYNNLGGIFTANASTIVKTAFTLDGTLAFNNYNLNMSYKRIAPDFTSLGATSLNDDLEEISGGIRWRLLQGKLGVSANAGLQRNNIEQDAAEGVKKVISAFNVFWLPTERLNLNATYSNFNSNTVRTATIDSDTLEFFLVTSNASLMASYRIGKGSLPQTLVFNGNYQEASDSDNNANNATNANMAYTIAFPATNFSGTISYNYNQTSTSNLEIITAGPTATLAKTIRKTVTLALSGSMLSSELDGGNKTNLNNFSFSSRYTWKQKHSFGLQYLYIERSSRVEGGLANTENRANFNYNYRF